jgi:hypothetical protein
VRAWQAILQERIPRQKCHASLHHSDRKRNRIENEKHPMKVWQMSQQRRMKEIWPNLEKE